MKTSIAILFTILPLIATSQVGIGTNASTPAVSAALDLSSTNSGVLIPRLTQTQRLGIVAPANGLLVYQTDNSIGFWYYEGTFGVDGLWKNFSGSAWGLFGNAGTVAGTNFLGTLNNQELPVKTNSSEAFRINNTQTVSIGTTTSPSNAQLLINNAAAGAIKIEDGRQAAGRILTCDVQGNAKWDTPSSLIASPDDDWRFYSGSLNSDPIYRTGPVQIGIANSSSIRFSTAPPLLLDVYNNTIKGTPVGVGDNEYIVDDDNLFQFSNSILPALNNSYSVGQTGLRWLRVYATNGVIQTSDSREKENIQPLPYGLRQLLQLKPVSYQWKEEKYGKTVVAEAEKTKKIGFLAQDLQATLPEVVASTSWEATQNGTVITYTEKPNQNLGVKYAEIIPVVVKATQEHQVTIEQIIKMQNEMLRKIEIQNSKTN